MHLIDQVSFCFLTGLLLLMYHGVYFFFSSELHYETDESDSEIAERSPKSNGTRKQDDWMQQLQQERLKQLIH